MKQDVKNTQVQFPVFNADKELDITATLNSIPAVLDKNLPFFRDVPDWFDADSETIDEYRKFMSEIENLPEEERRQVSVEKIQKILHGVERLIACYEMMTAPELAGSKKEVLRCICYWVALEAIKYASLETTSEDFLLSR